MKRNDQLQAEWFIRSQMRGIHIKKPVYMVYKWFEKDRRRDLDNISSYGRKIIQDSLVRLGILKDDGWKQITGFRDEFYVDKVEPRIEVIIEEHER